LRRFGSGHERLFRFLERFDAREQAAEILEPEAARVLVLAPHMDDEVLGCGGTLAAHSDRGGIVAAVYLTDGRYSAGPGDRPQPDLATQRRNESIEAAGILGIARQVFIAGAGHRLERDAEAAKELRAVLLEFRPEIVYLPGFLERHVDHRAAGDLLASALAGIALACECRAYEIWTPLMPNALVPIDAWLARKRAALACYRSQLEHSDFGHFVFALNAYRSSLAPGHGRRHAEAFYRAPVERYLRLHSEFREACAPT
jgi:LmbE family N-acetylglucosaminyl deacetylase